MKPKKLIAYNFQPDTSAADWMEKSEITAYSNKSFLYSMSSTGKKEQDNHSEEAKKEYWPLLEPL